MRLTRVFAFALRVLVFAFNKKKTTQATAAMPVYCLPRELMLVCHLDEINHL